MSKGVESLDRQDYIDSTKGIGILLVILGHLVTLCGFTSTFIYGFHMPLFFLISGIFASPQKYTFKTYFFRNVKRLLFPYIIYFLLGTIISLAIPVWRTFNWKQLVYAFLRADLGIVHVGATWFLVCLFIVVVLFYAFYHLIINRVDSTLIVVIMAFLGVGAYYVPKICSKVGVNLHYEYIDVAIMALFFYSTGFLLKNHIAAWIYKFCQIAIYKKLIVFISLILFYVLVNRENGFVGMVNAEYGRSAFLFIISSFFGITFTMILGKVTERIKILTFIGRNSLMIFSLHFIFIDLYSLALSTLLNDKVVSQRNLNVIQVIIGFIFVSSLTIGIAYLYGFVKQRIVRIRGI